LKKKIPRFRRKKKETETTVKPEIIKNDETLNLNK